MYLGVTDFGQFEGTFQFAFNWSESADEILESSFAHRAGRIRLSVGRASVATQMPPLTEDFDDLYVYTIPTLPLDENAALSAPTDRVKLLTGEHDADLDPDANNAAPFQWKSARVFLLHRFYARLPAGH